MNKGIAMVTTMVIILVVLVLTNAHDLLINDGFTTGEANIFFLVGIMGGAIIVAMVIGDDKP